jgi:hypothetical protein
MRWEIHRVANWSAVTVRTPRPVGGPSPPQSDRAAVPGLNPDARTVRAFRPSGLVRGLLCQTVQRAACGFGLLFQHTSRLRGFVVVRGQPSGQVGLCLFSGPEAVNVFFAVFAAVDEFAGQVEDDGAVCSHSVRR